MNLSICVEAMYRGLSCEQGIARAAAAGARAAEFWGWWNKDLEAVIGACEKHRITLTALCTRPAPLVDEKRHTDFLRGLEETVEVAQRLSCKTVIATVGDHMTSVSDQTQRDNIVAGLKQAACCLVGSGLTLVFEPLNTRVDHKGYFLWSSDEAAVIAQEVNHPQVKILYDIYHQQIMEGDILSRISKYLPWIGHMHAAGVPGRHELDQGELNYRYIFDAIDAMGYTGYAALELITDDPDAEVSRWCK